MPNLKDSLPKIKPVLDPEFVPIALWNRAFHKKIAESRNGEYLGVALERGDGSTTTIETQVLPHRGEGIQLNQRYVERLIKYMLWQKGGYKVYLAGDPAIAAYIAEVYSPQGERAFDHEFMGDRIYGKPFSVVHVKREDLPEGRESTQPLGGHWDGCRIGFDLGGSDRKCAAVIDGEVVHSEEVVWDPYFQKDPAWHYAGINDSLKRAAAKLPRVDAIGGSAAGVYVNNEVRVASLFRGVSRADFDSKISRMFLKLRKEWNNIPFEVVNDGEVTALAGAISLKDGAVLGVAMGTSLAAGYVTSGGHLTSGLDELAFVPVDMRDGAHVDEWSGDPGVGAQYFSQQAVGRLAPVAGIDLPAEMPLPEQLVEVQKLMEAGDRRAHAIYETIGTYFGYNVAQYAAMYELRHLLLLGRVLTGSGGELIVETAGKVLAAEFPELDEQVEIVTPGEKEKRLGQAVVAASLPSL
ncbi:MAG: ROK family protein [Acidobacteriota bacterium]|nr:MAG: ROK family protein [Acidobacteriota bacterium]